MPLSSPQASKQHASPIKQPEWEKGLWRNQPYPDNHVDESFLSSVRSLPSKPRPKLTTLFVAALPITQHVTIVALLVAVFRALLLGWVKPVEICWACLGAGGLGWGVWRLGWGSKQPEKVGPYSLLPPPTPLRPLLLPPLLLSLLSPILATLTKATTSDSIWPLAGGLFFVHLLLADFRTGRDRRLRRLRVLKRRARRLSVGARPVAEEEDVEKSLSSSLSLTSALSASIVLASRLPSDGHVFSLVLLATGLFAGFPVLAKGVREAGPRFSFFLTGSLLFLAVSLLPPTTFDLHPQNLTYLPHFISSLLTPIITLSLPAPALLTIVTLANVGGPLAFWTGWRWKKRRSGGWDVARPRVNKL